MTRTSEHDARAVLDQVYDTESRRDFATLIRLLGDFDLAEDFGEEFIPELREKEDKLRDQIGQS